MGTISLCMIVKNEEETLARCLESVRGVADEIVVVDTGSTDRTKEIAASFGAKVFDFVWIDDFSAARNFAFSKGTMEYLLWLDADDVLLEKDREALIARKATLTEAVDVVMLRYNTLFDEQGNVTFTYYRERLVRRGRGYRWVEPVHEYIATPGASVQRLDIAVTHKRPNKEACGGRNLRIYEQQLQKNGALSSRGMYYYARELRDHARYRDAARQFEAFLNDGRGWVEDNITACELLAECYSKLHDAESALRSLYRSFSYDLPRAELCCAIAYHYKGLSDFRRAAFWFELILSLEKPAGGLGFIKEDCWSYAPLVELAVCYDALGEPERANAFNERAAEVKPNAAAVQSNRAYFKNKLWELQAARKRDA